MLRNLTLFLRANAKAVLKVTTPFIGADLLYLPYGKFEV
jgi:hypothetical protein